MHRTHIAAPGPASDRSETGQPGRLFSFSGKNIPNRLTYGNPVALWAGGRKRRPEAAFRHAGAGSKPPEKRTGEVRAMPRARNQAREPRRRRRPPPPTRVTRETGTRLPGEPAAAQTPPFVMFAAFRAAIGTKRIRRTDERYAHPCRKRPRIAVRGDEFPQRHSGRSAAESRDLVRLSRKPLCGGP